MVGFFEFIDEEFDMLVLYMWFLEMVVQRMLNVGVEFFVVEKFVENDIMGVILIMLKFEDLKELGILFFGVRMLIWEEIYSMRDMQKLEFMFEILIEDELDKQVRREFKRKESGVIKDKWKLRLKINDVIFFLELVFIVGIEQVLLKFYQCFKGENCFKVKRYKWLMEVFQKDYLFFNDKGVIMFVGDFGKVIVIMGFVVLEEDEFCLVFDVVFFVVVLFDVMGFGVFIIMQYF